MPRSLPYLFLAVLLAVEVDLPAQETAEDGQPSEEQIRQWVSALGAAEYETREMAYSRLWEAGRVAIPHLEEARSSSDLEVADRIERLLPLLKWNITSSLVDVLGPRVREYDLATAEERLEILEEAHEKAPGTALPLFRAVLEAETARDPWEFALEVCREKDEDLIAHLEGLVDSGRGGSQILRFLGERYSQIPPGTGDVEAIVRRAGLVLAREGGFDDPEVYSRWMAALSAAGEEDLSLQVFRKGLEIFGESLEYRLGVATRMLELERPDRALAVVEGEAASAQGVEEIVNLLLRHSYPEFAWEAAKRALATFPTNQGLKVGLQGVFSRNLEFQRALEVTRTLETPDRTVLVLLHRYTLDAEGGIELARQALREEFERHPDDTAALEDEVCDLLGQYLHYGMGEEALALSREYAQVFSSDLKFLSLSLRAAVLGLSVEDAQRIEERMAEVSGGGMDFDTETDEARFLLALWRGKKDEIVAASSRLQQASRMGTDIDALFRAYHATGERSVLESRFAVGLSADSWPFDMGFSQGQIAEREGKPAEALYHYCRALAEIGSVPNTRLLWHWDEVHRKSAYLSRVPGALASALAEADKIENERIRRLTRGELLRQSGDWKAARAEFLAADPAPGISDARLEAGWCALESGEDAEARTLLEDVASDHDAEGYYGRVARRLLLVLARRRNDQEAETKLTSELSAYPPDPKAVYEAAFFLTSRRISEPAVQEWELILASHRPDSSYPFLHSNAWEYLAHLLSDQGREPERCAEYFLRGLQACWVNGYTIIEKGGERLYRAEIEHWRAKEALAGGNAADAILHLERALCLDPFYVSAARDLANEVRASDPELARRAGNVAAAELARQSLSEPTNPRLHEDLARVLEEVGDRVEALAAAKRARELEPNESREALVHRLEEGE